MRSSLTVGALVILTAGVLLAILRGIRAATTVGGLEVWLPVSGGDMLNHHLHLPEPLALEGLVEGGGLP